jgi:hypothetical protein
MPILPYQRFALDTTLPVEETCARLARSVEPRRSFRLGAGTCPFEGSVDGERFAIRRIILYRNSFLPLVNGSVEPTATGSRLRGTLTLHPLVAVFLALWIGIALMIGPPMLLSTEGDAPWSVRLTPLGIIGALGLVVSGAFTYEARRARSELVRIVTP